MQQLLSFLEEGGPWAITIILGWVAYKKDKEAKEAHAATYELSVEQVKTLSQLENTIKTLKDILLLRVKLNTNDSRKD